MREDASKEVASDIWGNAVAGESLLQLRREPAGGRARRWQGRTSTVSFGYDNDGLITSVDALLIVPSSALPVRLDGPPPADPRCLYWSDALSLRLRAPSAVGLDNRHGRQCDDH